MVFPPDVSKDMKWLSDSLRGGVVIVSQHRNTSSEKGKTSPAGFLGGERVTAVTIRGFMTVLL